MNRIENKFSELKKARQKAFIAFVTAGDPHLRHTPHTVFELEKAGVDIVELGMPFSDPMADGPVIQKSSERALKSGTTLRGILGCVARIRKQSQIPILLMGYYNPIFRYGADRFFKDAQRAGVDGVLLVDLPPEEGEVTQKAARRHNISFIYLLAPTSDASRIQKVQQKASGFIYYVSLTGITGAKLGQSLKRQSAFLHLIQQPKHPVCVGFGIKTPEQAREVSRLADGVVVGSAFVEYFAKHPPQKAAREAGVLARRLIKAIR